MMMKKTPEKSEEVRLQIAELVTIMINSTIPECFRAYLDDLVSILRALAMDPYGEVVLEACQGIYDLCEAAQDLLLHFAVLLGRSCFRALIHKHANIRVAGLKALYQVAFCGVWKYSYEIFEMLTAFRDPNSVEIREFYEHVTKFNYMAALVDDRSNMVRINFYQTLSNWLLKLPDKRDHEPRLFPYMLSAMNDENTTVQKNAFEQIEEMGLMYEEEEEEKLRETK